MLSAQKSIITSGYGDLMDRIINEVLAINTKSDSSRVAVFLNLGLRGGV